MIQVWIQHDSSYTKTAKTRGFNKYICAECSALAIEVLQVYTKYTQ